MADIDSFMSLDHMAEEETVELLEQHKYLAQHYGIRGSVGNPGFENEAPGEQLLGAVYIRIDAAKKPKTDWVALVQDLDIRPTDKLVVVHNGRLKKLEVSAVNPRGKHAAEVELKNG